MIDVKMDAERILLTPQFEIYNSLSAQVLSDESLTRSSRGINATGSGCRFRVWAPACQTLALEIKTTAAIEQWPMLRDEKGFFECRVATAGAGTLYRFAFADGARRPDPLSRFQPMGVHGWSEVIDPHAYTWQDADWRGIEKRDLIIYELHLGAFTSEGTYDAAIERLDELTELGVTAIELMPLAESAGRWNWGYDGVDFFSPRHTFGRPDDFRRFVDSAHQRDLAVILDVVYNHFGPEGNYLGQFGPYVSQKHKTAWGDAPNFDGLDAQHVRDFFTSNVAYWIDEFHLDGLRVDAIHCMADQSPTHIAGELADAVDALRPHSGRTLHMIAESNVYDRQMLAARNSAGMGYDAQWCDDFLHSVFAILRPSERMSQRTYDRDDLGTTLERGYVFEGSLTTVRQRIPLESQPHRTELESLVFSIQNHDFIGNHPLGQRLHQLTSHDAHRAAAALLLLYPAIPMIFMGEEFASENPFFFFVDYSDADMRRATEIGRRAEYPQHDWSEGASPLSDAAFSSSNIGPTPSGNGDTLDWYKSLIRLRKQWKAQGRLLVDRLHTQWVADLNLAVLRYEGVGLDQACFVVVRLNPAAGSSVPVRLSFSGELALSQNCQPTDLPSQYLLGANAVAVGTGPIQLH